MNIIFLAIFFLINVVSTQLNPLVTKDQNGDYISILKKNGDMTQWFRGGIYVRRGQRNNYNYEPVHKAIEQNWIIQPVPLQNPPPINQPIPPLPNPLRLAQNLPLNPNLAPNNQPPQRANQILGRRQQHNDDLTQQNQIRRRNNPIEQNQPIPPLPNPLRLT